MQVKDRVQAADPARTQLAYGMPTSSDVGVSTFRRWLPLVGGGPFTGSAAAAVPPALRVEALSRWEAHGKYCPKCRRAAAWFGISRTVSTRLAYGAATVGLGLALASWASPVLRLVLGLTPAVVVLVLALAMYGLAQFADGSQRALFGSPARELWLAQVFLSPQR
mmetsp:Transcript_5634/g.14784  ORF Transcript_5634/g.14784 Transcript_5634/m.14784 type:complete len:165 (-) Transcript_5634:22-516(-)